MPICEVNPANILDISIASKTLTLHKHNMQSRMIDVTTGLKKILVNKIYSFLFIGLFYPNRNYYNFILKKVKQFSDEILISMNLFSCSLNF